MVRFIATDTDRETQLRTACQQARGRYLVLDLYDYVEVLFDGDDLHQARRARRERLIDTDGEAHVVILVREEG